MTIKTQSYNKSTKNTKEKILTKQGYIFYDKTIKTNLSDLPKNLSEKLINFYLKINFFHKIFLGIAYATPALHMQYRRALHMQRRHCICGADRTVYHQGEKSYAT